jgi:hypothetical protein
LQALRAKDRSRLAEATALRSQNVAGPGGEAPPPTKKQELFAKILDESISDTELDDLAKQLDGFQVAGENAAKSTGSLGIIIHKPTDDGGYLSRVLTVRRERKGWGVMDVSRETVFKGMTGQRRRQSAGRN